MTRRPLRDLLAPPDAAAVERTWRKIADRRAASASSSTAPFPRRRLTHVAAAGLATAAAALTAFVLWPRTDRDAGALSIITASDQPTSLSTPIATDLQPRAIDLSDGSRVELAPHSNLTVRLNTGSHLRLALDRGRTIIHVQPGGPRRWTIDCGPATVEVTGTRFSIDRSPSRVEVAVTEGHVRVTSPELLPTNIIDLTAGQHVTIPIRIITAASGQPETSPDTSHTGQPDTSHTGQPDTSHTGQPDTGRVGRPETGRVGQPDTGRTERVGQPDTGRTGQPDTGRVGRVGQPDTGRTGHAGPAGQPDAGRTGHAGPAGQPDTGRTGQPDTGCTGHAGPAGQPDTGRTGQPDTGRTGRVGQPDTARVVGPPDTGRVRQPDTARVVGQPDSGRVRPPDTGPAGPAGPAGEPDAGHAGQPDTGRVRQPDTARVVGQSDTGRVRQPDTGRAGQPDTGRLATGAGGGAGAGAAGRTVTWREHVARRDYRAAFEVLGERGMGEETAKAGTIEQLVMLADVARLSGHARAAVAPLRRAAAMEGAAAAVAGYSLGRLLLDELREFGAAATAIEGAIGKGLPGGLDEPALARLVEAHARAKHAADAKRWAEVYERKYPRGREVEAVRRWRAAR